MILSSKWCLSAHQELERPHCCRDTPTMSSSKTYCRPSESTSSSSTLLRMQVVQHRGGLREAAVVGHCRAVAVPFGGVELLQGRRRHNSGGGHD
jgi:hypothetical protein